MPVDKFGHTDSASTQRVVAGGVTLTQINNSFARIDGSNAFVGNLNMGGNSIKGLPTDFPGDHAGDEAVSFSQAMALVAGEIHNREDPTADTDFTNKRYVDEQDAMKVSKTGDTVSGDLFIAASSDPAVDRILGCNNLLERQRFTLLLGNTGNKITFLNSPKNAPAVIRTANGLRVRINDEVAIEIVKDGRDTVSRINVFKPIYMNGAGITGLAEPTGDGSAATKKYVDNSWKKCHVGYIPNLEANNSITGFYATASSSSRGHEAYRAFNNLSSGDSWFSGVDGETAWLQIKCPEPVIIWRLALKTRMDLLDWNLSGSNDGRVFTGLLENNPVLHVDSAPIFLDISTTTAYKYYKLTMLEDDWLMQGIETMQLYVYDT